MVAKKISFMRWGKICLFNCTRFRPILSWEEFRLKLSGGLINIVKTRGQIKLDFGINPPHGQQMSVDAEYYWESFRHKREE